MEMWVVPKKGKRKFKVSFIVCELPKRNPSTGETKIAFDPDEIADVLTIKATEEQSQR